MNKRLSGKTAIITGAGKGMGAVTAKLFAEQGAQVILADVDYESATLVASEIGKKAKAIKLDVSNEQNWLEVIEAAEAMGSINVLVNNAGILDFKPIIKQSADDFMRIINVNLLGCYNGIRAAIEPMKRAGGGSIINISSIDGLQAKNSLSAYAASKWGIRGLTKSAAIELGIHQIRVNSLHPGGINNEMGMSAVENVKENTLEAFYKHHPIPRAGYPIEVARMSAFLASDEASYSTGSEFIVDGGWNAGLSLDFLEKS